MKPLSPANSYPKPTQSTQDYFPFGSLLPGRGVDQGEYERGFNGQEQDKEVSGSYSTHYEFKFREYDSRLGRFWKVDPLFASYPWNSPYAFAENRPIDGIDLEGKEFKEAGKSAPEFDPNVQGYQSAMDNTAYSSVDSQTKLAFESKPKSEISLPASFRFTATLTSDCSGLKKIKGATEGLSMAGNTLQTTHKGFINSSIEFGFNPVKNSGKFYKGFRGNMAVRMTGDVKSTFSFSQKLGRTLDWLNLGVNAIRYTMAEAPDQKESIGPDLGYSIAGVIASEIHPALGLTIGMFSIVAQQKSTQDIITKIHIENEIKRGIWQINMEPQFLSPGE